MSKKFIIACPNCGRYAEADSGFFAKKTIPCTCGHVINVRTERMASIVCSNCGNSVVYDQAKGQDAECPICHTAITVTKKKQKEKQYVTFHCGECGCELSVEKGTRSHECPLCGTEIDVTKRLEEEKVRAKGLANIICLGKLWAEEPFCTREVLDAALAKCVPPKKQHLLEPNRKALQMGIDLAE